MYSTIKFTEVTLHINLISGPPRVRLQNVLDHQFRIEFPSTGKKWDLSIPGGRKLEKTMSYMTQTGYKTNFPKTYKQHFENKHWEKTASVKDI